MSYLKEHDEHDDADSVLITEVVYLSSSTGTLKVEQCVKCPYFVNVRCEHTQNSWNTDGTQLTCDLCGDEGT